jgi:hypothetical protein
MDLGATICTPKSPACGICPLMPGLRRAARGSPRPAREDAEEAQAHAPRHRLPRAARRWRLAAGTRPDKGLLGGMLGWPGHRLGEDAPRPPALAADWRDPGAEVRHTFTHFHLRLRCVWPSWRPMRALRGTFVARHAFRPSDLPTVMRKAYDLALRPAGELIATGDRRLCFPIRGKPDNPTPEPCHDPAASFAELRSALPFWMSLLLCRWSCAAIAHGRLVAADRRRSMAPGGCSAARRGERA